MTVNDVVNTRALLLQYTDFHGNASSRGYRYWWLLANCQVCDLDKVSSIFTAVTSPLKHRSVRHSLIRMLVLGV